MLLDTQANQANQASGDDPLDVWMDAKQVQAFLNISASTHHFLMHNAGLPRGTILGKRIVRYQKAKIVEWLASRPSSGTAA